MILCLDAGNTRLKWGLFDPATGWKEMHALSYGELHRPKLPVARIAVVANVAGADVGARLAGLLAGTPVHMAVSLPTQCGVTNGYENPAQLGVDRWAALIGARSMHAGPCVVVMAGTATTVDVMDAAGVFRGGLILPGLDLMRASLAQNTAQLRLDEGKFRDLPRNTADAMLSGCLQAQAGAVERMFAQVRDVPDALCLLGGGGAARLEPLLRIPCRRVEHLVLEGLARIGMSLPQTPEKA